MSQARNKIIPAVFLLLRKGKKVFLLRRFNTGFQDGSYSLISGHVDAGESPTSAMCREAQEEAGIRVNSADLRFEQVLYRRSYDNVKSEYDPKKPERVDFFFSTDMWEGDPYNAEPDKCDDVSWFNLNKLPEKIFPVVSEFLKEIDTKQQFKESGY